MRPHRAVGSGRRLRVRRAQRTSDRQARAALGAASRQNLAASDRLHPRAKPVGTCAFHFRRLISAFHDDNLCWRSGERSGGQHASAHRRKSLTLERVTTRVSMSHRIATVSPGGASDHFHGEARRAAKARSRLVRLWITLFCTDTMPPRPVAQQSRHAATLDQFPASSLCIPFRNPRRGPPVCLRSSASSRPSNLPRGSAHCRAPTSPAGCD